MGAEKEMSKERCDWVVLETVWELDGIRYCVS